ncbi:MAG: hypothetical protein K2H45_12505 [Acetatifactor sp.]|nr:hypothetical protein [Acetatifactor sp.]
MKRVVFLYEKMNEAILRENLLILRRIWEDLEYEVTELVIEEQTSPDIYMNELVRLGEDFLVTFAMAGFAWRGFTEQARFNVLATMQIHILIGNLPHYDFYLQEEYGIQCFFVTDCKEIFEDWKKRYPQLPFMSRIPTLYLAEHLTEIEREANYANLREMLLGILAFIENPMVL